MDEIIRMLLSMGKTKEEIAEFVGKEMPAGGITKTTNIIKPITKKVAGDFPLIGSRITDPTQAGQLGRYNLQALDPKDRYSLIRQSIEDQKLNWQKTLEFIREGGYSLSKLQEQNLNFNLGVLQKSKVIIKDIEKGLINEGQNVEEIYQAFVKNKRFLGNEKTGLSGEANEILDFIETTRGKGEDLTKTTKSQEQILKDQKVANDKRMKRLYEGRPYEGDVGLYRTLGGYHLPKLHEAGIINLDPKVYEALKAGKYHHGGADFFAPDPNRILRYHFGSKIFDDLDKAIEKAAINGEGVPLKGPEGMIKFLKDNDYLPFKKDGPKNSLDYMTDGEKLERVKELDEGTELIKKGDSPFFKTPDAIMGRVMENANDKKLYLESFKRTHPEKYKLYEKTQSEEPFFGLGDVNQPDPFGDLSDLTFPKDKGDLIKFPKKKKIKPVDENKRLLTEDEIEDYTELLGDTEYWMMDGTLGEAKKALKISKAEEAEMFDLYKTGKLDPEAGSVTRSRMNFLRQRLEEAEGSGDTRLISEDEIFELEGLEKRFRKEDIEFKVNEQPERKLTDEEIKELKNLTDNDDFDFAEGGIINLAEGGRINYGNGSGGLFDSFLTAKNVDRGINLLQNNKGIVDFFANNLTSLPSSGRAFAKNLAGSTSPINEDFFSNNQLEEIKSRTAESMANKSMRYRPDVVNEEDPSKNEFYGDFDTVNNVIGYSEDETKRPISVKGIFTDPKVDIDATLGKAVYKQNLDGTISVIDKHDFDGIGGGSTLYGEEQGNLKTGAAPKIEGLQGLPFLEPYRGETQFDYKYETQESMLEGAIKAYKNGKISASKLSRIIGGMYGQQGFINNSKYGSGESLIKKNQFLSSIPVNINLGKISQIDKLKANKNFANYIFNNRDIPSKIRKDARRYADIQTKPTPNVVSTPTTIQTTNRDDRPTRTDPSQGNTRTGFGRSGYGRDPNDRMAQGGIIGLKR